jgi:hypothetical protein
MRLRAASPEGWEEFLVALRAYVSSLKDKMVITPQEYLVDARGQVIGAVGIVKQLETAQSLIDRIERNYKNG